MKIISAYDDRFLKIGKISELSIKKYAKHFKYDYQIYKIKKFKERPPAWFKIKVLMENLKDSNHDYIIWVDSDAFFCRYKNIMDSIDRDKNLFRDPINALVKLLYSHSKRKTHRC